MNAHRPTLGSGLRVMRDPIRNKRKCACGQTWPCNAATADDLVDDDEPPADFLLNGKELFPLSRRNRGEHWRPS